MNLTFFLKRLRLPAVSPRSEAITKIPMESDGEAIPNEEENIFFSDFCVFFLILILTQRKRQRRRL